jgi:hypothetical protein
MNTITIKEFAQMAVDLEIGRSIKFQTNDEYLKTTEYILTLVRVGDSACLLLNRATGGRPLVIDVTIYDTDLINICDQLDLYINKSIGVYGFVTILDSDASSLSDESVSTLGSPGFSLHICWEEMSQIASDELSLTAERMVKAKAEYDDYGWGIRIDGATFTAEETDAIFRMYDADKDDRMSEDFGEDAKVLIKQELAVKIISAVVPFPVVATFMDSGGVWFLGASGAEQLMLCVRYPEIDMEPDIIRFTLPEGVSRETLIACIDEASNEILTQEDSDDGRLEHLDTFLGIVRKRTGCCTETLRSTYDVDIW